jgi:hypothetical protein
MAGMSDGARAEIAAEVGSGRFTMGLALDVAQVLTEHGFDELNAGQVVELQQHLYHFLYGEPDSGCMGGVA